MNNTKLIRLLKTFSHDEFHEFGKFISSPFHNESPKMAALYNYLKKYYPLFDNPKLTKESVFGRLYSGAKYDDKKMRDRFSDMLRLAEDYLAFANFKKDTALYKMHTLNEYAHRMLPVHFEKKYREVAALLDTSYLETTSYFRNRHTQVRHKVEFYQNPVQLAKKKNIHDEFMVELRCFLKYAMAEILDFYSVMINWEGNINYKFDYSFCKPVCKFVEENDFLESPLIKGFYLVIKIKEDESRDELYRELKKVFMENFSLFDLRDKIFFITMLFNDSQRRFMDGREGFEAERLEIMKFQLEHDIYPQDDGWLSREQYFNFIMIPVMAGEIEWAEKFVKNYTERLAPDFRRDAKLLGTAFICLYRKKYDEALSALSEIEARDPLYYIRIKLLLSRIYFDTEDYEKVFSVIDSFKHYLVSNTLLPGYVVKRYTNYLTVLRKLVLLVHSADEYKLTKLVEEIKSYSLDELTTNKTWMLKKAKELQEGVKKTLPRTITD